MARRHPETAHIFGYPKYLDESRGAPVNSAVKTSARRFRGDGQVKVANHDNDYLPL